jgi:hypothetical protein
LHDAAVIVPELIPAPRSVSPCSASLGSSRSGSEAAVTNFLKDAGIEEVETLNQSPRGPTAGQCQFSSVAASLLDNLGPLFDTEFRPDLDLRQLAVHTIYSNPHMYEDFLLASSQGRTTRASSRSGCAAGGRGINLSQYLKNMSNPRCDGDAVTLQALCDSLKITIRIVKPVEASFFQGDWQAERFQNALRQEGVGRNAEGGPRCSTPCCSSPDSSSLSSLEGDDIINLCDEDSSSPFTTRSPSPSLSSSSSEDEIEMGLDTEVADSGNGKFSFDIYRGNIDGRKRLYISQEIQPRRLDRIDPRLLEVQQITQGRLVWLSHIGDEAHYRYLRATCPSSLEEEACEVSKSVRVARINEICGHQDGLMKSPASSIEEICEHQDGSKHQSAPIEEIDAVATRCTLCLERFSRLNGSPIVAPPCRHMFHQDCLSLWSTSKSVKCVICSCSSDSVTDARTNSEIFLPFKKCHPIKYVTGLDLDCVQDFLHNFERLQADGDKSNCGVGKVLDAMQAVFAWLENPSRTSDFGKEENIFSLFCSLNKFSRDATEFLLSETLDMGLLLVLRTIVGLLEPVPSIFHRAILGISDFCTTIWNRNSTILNVEHLEKSGGLLYFLLHQLHHMNELRDFFACFCSLSRPVECGIGSKRVLKFEGTELEAKTWDSKKRKTMDREKVNDVPPSSKSPKKRVETLSRPKKKVSRKVPAVPPVKPVEEVVVHRAPGKRRVKPVDTTNISREHLALRCYMGAV